MCCGRGGSGNGATATIGAKKTILTKLARRAGAAIINKASKANRAVDQRCGGNAAVFGTAAGAKFGQSPESVAVGGSTCGSGTDGLLGISTVAGTLPPVVGQDNGVGHSSRRNGLS